MNVYGTDALVKRLIDAQFTLITPLIPSADPGGRHRSVGMREINNGILSLNRTSWSWRILLHEFPPWSTMHYYNRLGHQRYPYLNGPF